MSGMRWVVRDEWCWDEWCKMSGVWWVVWDRLWWGEDACCVSSGVRWAVVRWVLCEVSVVRDEWCVMSVRWVVVRWVMVRWVMVRWVVGGMSGVGVWWVVWDEWWWRLWLLRSGSFRRLGLLRCVTWVVCGMSYVVCDVWCVRWVVFVCDECGKCCVSQQKRGAAADKADEAGGGTRRDATEKIRTPHSDVGNNPLLLCIVLVKWNSLFQTLDPLIFHKFQPRLQKRMIRAETRATDFGQWANPEQADLAENKIAVIIKGKAVTGMNLRLTKGFGLDICNL